MSCLVLCPVDSVYPCQLRLTADLRCFISFLVVLMLCLLACVLLKVLKMIVDEGGNDEVEGGSIECSRFVWWIFH